MFTLTLIWVLAMFWQHTQMYIYMYESQMLLKFSSYTRKLVAEIRMYKGKKSKRTEMVVIFLSVEHDSLNIQGKCQLSFS